MKYSFSIGINKAIKYLVIFALPFLVNQFVVSFPEEANLPIGSVLVLLVNWLKVKVGVRFL